MSTPDVKFAVAANIFCRMMHFKEAGDVEHGHAHHFDHITLLATGALRVKANGLEQEFQAPHVIQVAARVKHELTALQPNTIAYCIHALREKANPQEVLDPNAVPVGQDALAVAHPLLM